MTEVVTEIRMIPTREIKPYFRNPRENDRTVEKLIELIPKVGFNVPLVIDGDGVIVKGHSRWRAAIRLGMTELPCVITKADAEAIRMDRISDNRVQELSGWDEELLKSELAAIDSRFAVDLTSLGLTIEDEIRDALKNLSRDPEPEPDRDDDRPALGGGGDNPGGGAASGNGSGNYGSGAGFGPGNSGAGDDRKPFISQKDIDNTHPDAGNIDDFTEVTCNKCGNNMFIRKRDR